MSALTQTAKMILNALPFANVSNLNEFHALLQKIDAPTAPEPASGQRGATSYASASYAAAPGIGRIQGAQ